MKYGKPNFGRGITVTKNSGNIDMSKRFTYNENISNIEILKMIKMGILFSE